MTGQKSFEFIIVGLWLAIAAALYIHFKHDAVSPIVTDPTAKHLKADRKCEIVRISVIRGDTFDIVLKEDNARILAKLPVASTEDAKKKVTDLLNHSEKPRVVLKEKNQDGSWKVEIKFTFEGAETDLAQWLQANNLIYR